VGNLSLVGAAGRAPTETSREAHRMAGLNRIAIRWTQTHNRR
jgi:hypothetical protein